MFRSVRRFSALLGYIQKKNKEESKRSNEKLKRILALLLTLTLIVGLVVACANEPEVTPVPEPEVVATPEPAPEEDEEYDYEDDILEEELDDGTIIFTLTEEARDIVLEDFDYMVNAILENSPWDSVLERTALTALDVDFETYVDFFRAFIEDMTPLPLTPLDEELFRAQFPIHEGDDARSMAANYLFALLTFEFAPPLFQIGHLGPRTLDMYTAQLVGILREPDMENNMSLQIMYDAFTHPSAVWFYGELDEALIDNVDGGGLFDGFPNATGNIQTEILVPDEVAFLRINSFVANPEYDELVTLPFLQEIQDYDHLIIDLRGNLGGLQAHFPITITQHLIGEPTEFGIFEFFSGGSKSYAVVNATLGVMQQGSTTFDWQEFVHSEIMPAEDFIASHDLHEFNQDDLERLDYVFVSRAAMLPSEDSVNFTGKVWLLVDGFSASASVGVASFMISSGVGTVVGENTSHVLMSQHFYMALPNTGIIWRIDVGYQTDMLGNSIEANGLAPQIRNFDGMDALETVLELIAQGEY